MKDIKIKDAVFFPEPQLMYRELPISKAMGAEAQEYMKAWEFNGLLVFASVAEYDDGREWLHISFSRKNRIPTYDDMTRIKRDFIGEDKKAVMILYTGKYMTAIITRIDMVDGKNTDLNINKPVYAIHLADVRKE